MSSIAQRRVSEQCRRVGAACRNPCGQNEVVRRKDSQHVVVFAQTTLRTHGCGRGKPHLHAEPTQTRDNQAFPQRTTTMTITSNLSGSAKRALRAAAHHLDPVVMIGDKGLTSAVLHEIDIALTAHALIKVRVASDDREQRVAFMGEICEKLACESVQHLGKLLVLWRNKEGDDGVLDDDVENIAAPAARARGPRKKLANEVSARSAGAAGFRRPDANDPRPREGRSYVARGDAAAGFEKPSGGFSKPTGDRYAPPPRGRAPSSRGADGNVENRRYRRSDDAAPQDTRPPREGWAPRGRRGAGRTEGGAAGGARGFGGRSRDDAASGGAGGGSEHRQPRGGATGGFDARAPRGGAAEGYERGRGAAADRAPAGGGRWGARDRASAPSSRGTSGGAGAAPKPRARRRLG